MAACVAPAFASVEWMTDLPAAQQKAGQEGKAVFVNFTGSDWCGWCVRMHKAVYSTQRFENFISDKFVPMEVDIPNRNDFDAQLRVRNEQLCVRYNVQGFPTALILSPQGDVIGGFNGAIMDQNKVETVLTAALANLKKLNEAEKLDGSEKAKAMFAVYSSLEPRLRDCAHELAAKIAELDTANETGIKRMLAAKAQQQQVMEKLSKLQGDNAAQQAIAIIDEALAGDFPENRNNLLNLKAQILTEMATTKEDILKIRDIYLEIFGQDPKRRAAVEKQFANPEAILKQLEKRREARRNSPAK